MVATPGLVWYIRPSSAFARSRRSCAGPGHEKSLLIANDWMGHVMDSWSLVVEVIEVVMMVRRLGNVRKMQSSKIMVVVEVVRKDSEVLKLTSRCISSTLMVGASFGLMKMEMKMGMKMG
jgi:hypothetical protein